MRKHSAFLSSIYGYINAFVISFGSHVRFVMMVFGSAFRYKCRCCENFSGDLRRKTSKNLRKKSAEQRKNLLIFGVFMEKTAKKPTFFEILWRNFNADKSDNQGHFFFHES